MNGDRCRAIALAVPVLEAGVALPAVQAAHLTKTFRSVEAVSDVSVEILPGEVFAFFGPDGAGKSTTMNMLCTLIRPTGGLLRVAGFDAVTHPREVRRRIGVVFQGQTLDEELTARQVLRFPAVFISIEVPDARTWVASLSDFVGLGDRNDDTMATCSGATVRRLAIARALLPAPRVLFLDEPTTGLDPRTRALLWLDLLPLCHEQGVTVVLATQNRDEADLADRIAIIDHGKILALGTPAELRNLC